MLAALAAAEAVAPTPELTVSSSSLASSSNCTASLAVARRSDCPADNWLDAIHGLLTNSSQMVYVNVGVNKGYNVADFLQRWPLEGAPTPPSSQAWYKKMLSLELDVQNPCGMCNDCKRQTPAHPRPVASLRILALDLLQANVDMVRRLFDAFGVPGKVVHAAASNELGTVYAPSVPTSSTRNDFYSPGKPGEERVQALPNAGLHRFTRFTRYNYTQRVPQLTVDALLRQEAVHDVDLLTIDTEGHDALVLEGAAETLAARRVKVLEFEYSGAGMWKNGGPKHRTLKATLERLHRLRYECFWAGKDGHVAPASGPFWCDAFEFHEWSNLLCAHAPRVLHVLYELARRAGNVVGDAPLDGDRRRAHW